MTVFVTGGNGQLGRALRTVVPDARFVDVQDCDITDRASLQAQDWSGVSAIVNAAAWTAVDAAERDDRLLTAWDVNATGVANLAWQARRLSVPLVHVSTDYVLRGDHEGDAPVTAAMDPQGQYGISKAAGELAARIAPTHYVLRTSWVFGDGPNFVRTMRRLAQDRDEVRVVDDQVGRPTYAVDLAEAVVRAARGEVPVGTHHATGGGPAVSWAGFAAAVLEGTGCRVVPITTAEYAAGAPGTAPRPTNSALEAGALGLRDWREALADYLRREAASA